MVTALDHHRHANKYNLHWAMSTRILCVCVCVTHCEYASYDTSVSLAFEASPKGVTKITVRAASAEWQGAPRMSRPRSRSGREADLV